VAQLKKYITKAYRMHGTNLTRYFSRNKTSIYNSAPVLSELGGRLRKENPDTFT
jgi:hypothetical protein